MHWNTHDGSVLQHESALSKAHQLRVEAVVGDAVDVGQLVRVCHRHLTPPWHQLHLYVSCAQGLAHGHQVDQVETMHAVELVDVCHCNLPPSRVTSACELSQGGAQV